MTKNKGETWAGRQKDGKQTRDEKLKEKHKLNLYKKIDGIFISQFHVILFYYDIGLLISRQAFLLQLCQPSSCLSLPHIINQMLFHISTAQILYQQINSQSHKHLRVMKNQTSSDANTKSSYIFCFTEKEPQTLVMLKRPQNMKDIIKRKSFFVVVKVSYFSTEQAKRLSQITNSTVKIFETVESAYTFANKYAYQVSAYIICSSEHWKEVQKIKVMKNIYVSNQRRQVQEIKSQKMKNNRIKFCQLNDKQSIEKMISETSKLSYNKLFSSFISQRNRISKSNRLVENMVAMLKQKLDKKTTQKVLEELKNLLKNSDPEQNQYEYDLIEDNINELLGDLSQEKIIQIYTNDSGFDKLINSLLRSSYHPTEIFYIQAFFQKLFNTIKQKSQTNKISSVVVFRGGISCQQQIIQMRQSVGNLIQNIFFMSTSLNIQTAWGFKKGYIKSMTTITIVDQKQQPARNNDQQQLPRSLNLGYCDISKHSSFTKENEILFNPLNSFLLLQFKQIYKNPQDEWPVQIEMKLLKIEGQISKIQQISNNQLSKISLQGHALVDKQLNQHGCSEYWQEFKKIAVTPSHKVQALINLIYIDNNQRKFKSAIKKAQQCQNILKQALTKGQSKTLQDKIIQIQQLIIITYQNDYQYEKARKKWEDYSKYQKKSAVQQQYTLIMQAPILNGLGKFQQAIDIYKKSIHKLETLVDKKNYKQYLRYLEVYVALSVALKNNGKNQEAYEILRKCNNKKLKILGEDHPCYLTSLQNEANLQGEQFLLKENLQKSMKCLRLKQLIYGKSHPLCLSSQNSIATNLFSQRKFDKSLQILLFCKANYEQIGEINTQYLNVLHNISCIYSNQNRRGQAFAKIEQCLNLAGRIMQKQHLLYVQYLNTKAQMLYQVGRFEQCLTLSKQIISIISKQLRVDHPLNLQVRLRIAKSYDKLNQQKFAYLQYQNCANFLVSYDHDPRILFMNSLYVLDFFRQKQKYHKSLPLLQKLFCKAGNFKQRCYKLMVTTFMPIYFHIYERLGKYGEVNKIFEIKKFSSEQQKNQWVIFAFYNFFLLYIKQGDFGQAFSCLQKCLKLLKEKKIVNLKNLMPAYQMLNQIFIDSNKLANSSTLQIYHLIWLDKVEKNPELLERKKSQCNEELRLTKQKLQSQKKKTRGSKCFIALGSS